MKTNLKNNKSSFRDKTISKATRIRWNNDAEYWALELKKEIAALGGRDLPPGFDPDDKHNYYFRIGLRR